MAKNYTLEEIRDDMEEAIKYIGDIQDITKFNIEERRKIQLAMTQIRLAITKMNELLLKDH